MAMREAFLLLMSALGITHGASAAPAQPNVVLILADDLGFSDLSCYGGDVPTPHLDKLAQAGVRFTQFYNCARCCPTRASLLSGLYPHQAGVGHMLENWKSPAYTPGLGANVVTIPQRFARVG
jgi:arylsulfatase A-like enzyme